MFDCAIRLFDPQAAASLCPPRGEGFILKRLNLTPDRARLIASLGFNILAKAPGVAAVFIVLPLISRALGPSTYGELLSALALGALFILPFDGVNAVGRRLLAAAVGDHDKIAQANVFMSTAATVAGVACAGAAVMVLVSARHWTAPAFILVSLLPILAASLNTFGDLRGSFNEHYVTAAFQLIFQIAIYGAVFFIGLPKGAVILSALALVAPFALASFASLIMLLGQRPFLLRGRVEDMRPMILPAVGVMMAEGALGATFSLSITYLNFAGEPQMAAWVGTFTRLYASFVSILLLILFPLVSYISIRWKNMPQPRKLQVHRLFVVGGLAYGALVGCAMPVVGVLYINTMFNLPVRGDAVDVFALSLFMGAVVAQKTYALLAYAISEAKFISFGAALVVGLGVAAGALASLWLQPARAVDVLFFTIGSGLPVLLLTSAYRQHRHLRKAPPLEPAKA